MPIPTKEKQLEMVNERLNHLIDIIAKSKDKEEVDQFLHEKQQLIEQRLNIENKIIQEKEQEYRELKEDEQDRQEDQDLEEEKTATRGAIRRGVKSVSNDPNQLETLTPKQKLEIEKQLKLRQNFVLQEQERNEQDFEHSDQHLQEELTDVRETSKDLGHTLERVGQNELSYSKELGEASTQGIIKKANDSSSYNQKELFSGIKPPVPTPGSSKTEQDEESYYNNITLRAS